MKQTSKTLGAFLSTDVATIPIADGVLTITSAMVIAQAQTGTADDIDTITPNIEGINSGDLYFILIEADAGDTITLKHGTGNMTFVNGTDIVLASGARALLFGSATAGFDDVALSAGGGGGSGAISADTLVLNDGSELTISSDAITVTKARHTVDTEADVSSDDLATINGLAAGEICIISASHTDRTVVIKNGTGNIACSSGADISLDATEKEVLLYGRASTVLAIPLYNLGSSGGSNANTALSNLAAVAINTSLVSDTNDTDDLGSASIQWKDIWAKSSYANQVMAAYNNSGSTIATEQLVYINGHNAGTDEPTIALADRDSAASAYAVGITQASAGNAASGRIITRGIVTYPTTGMTAGDVLYLSSTAGALTNTKPTSGYLQVVAVVIEVGGTGTGRILLIPQTPLDLDSIGGGISGFSIVRNTASGTITGGSWQTVPIAEGTDPDGLITVASNQMTFAQAGWYTPMAVSYFAATFAQAMFRLRDVTNGVTLSTTNSHNNSGARTSRSFKNPFEIPAANTVVELQVYLDVNGSFSQETTPSGTGETYDALNWQCMKWSA